MKTNHTDEQYQAAIDAACEETTIPSSYQSLDLRDTYSYWKAEQPARLHLIKSAIALLPETPPPVVDGKTPGQVAYEGYDASGTWIQSVVHDKWEAAASAVLAAFGNPQLSTLRPISEAGPVPAGCVRFTGFIDENGDWKLGNYYHEQDTHFADIRVDGQAPTAEKPFCEPFESFAEKFQEVAEPILGKSEVFVNGAGNPVVPDPYAELKAAHAQGKVIEYRDEGTNGAWKPCNYSPGWFMKSEYRIKPELETFTAHGKTWTRHTPGDPMPCDGEERMVQVLYDAQEGRWREDTAEGVNWKKGTSVTGWRYADEPTPEPVKPWTPKVGDVVRLKSGGPKMTVHELFPEEDRVICYHYKKGRLETPTFATATLTPA